MFNTFAKKTIWIFHLKETQKPKTGEWNCEDGAVVDPESDLSFMTTVTPTRMPSNLFTETRFFSLGSPYPSSSCQKKPKEITQCVHALCCQVSMSHSGNKKTKTPFVSNKFPTSYLSYPLFSGGPNFSPKRWTVWKVGVFEGSNFRPPMTASVLSTLHWKDQRWRGLTICEWQTANSRIGQEKWSQKALYTKFLFKKKNVDYFFTWACALLLGFSENINTIISSLWCSRWLQGRSSISSALHQESMGFSKETVEGQDTPFAKSFHHFFRVQQFLCCFFSPDPKCFWFVPFLPFVPVDRCHKNSRKKSGKLT